MVTDAFVIRRLLKGFEPLTFRLQGDCAAYCATRANKKYLYSNIVLLKCGHCFSLHLYYDRNI